VSQENIETVRHALSALDRRDVEAYLQVASPEIELISPATPLEGPTTGHDGIRRFFGELEAYSETSAFQVEEMRAVNDRVLAFFTLTTTGRNSGAETSVKVAGVYDVEGGKLRRAHIYAVRAEALEALGL
jgi:ketosteroid isomerase-like protein